MRRQVVSAVVPTVLAALLVAAPLAAMPPYEKVGPPLSKSQAARFAKEIDQPNATDRQRVLARGRLLAASPEAMVESDALGLSGTDRVLVILVEFGGPDEFTFTPGDSTWDPIGHADATEYTGESGTAAACASIIAEHGISGPTLFTYQGPLHNTIERPLSAADSSGTMIWTPDFSPAYYRRITAGDGWLFAYKRQDGSRVRRDFRGSSVARYFKDQSGGKYTLATDVVGWLTVPHAAFWYGADPCPGARSGASPGHNGGLAAVGGGTARDLVKHALDAVNAADPSFDWGKYDQNGDGVIDRLWIIHAGIGEEDSTTALNRTSYGEGGLWSHSSSIFPAYAVGGGIAAGPYIMMPENAGIAVLAHEAGHNIGAMDLYAYGEGETSAGFWTVMADDWTGDPIGFLPPALDPMHLEQLGWLKPYTVIANPAKVTTVTLGQASRFPGGPGVKRAVRIALPDGSIPLPVAPDGSWYWWGGAEDATNGSMTLNTPLQIPAGGATLSFSAAWNIEPDWDFLWVQASANGGTSWTTLTNGETSCTHDPGWIGALYGFPADLCGAGIGGFSGTSASWPDLQTETFDLGAFAGQQVLLRFWYMTDWATLGSGPFIDNILVTAPGPVTLFSDGAESGGGSFTYVAPFERNAGADTYPQNYYLQWRNTGAGGGYDRTLGSRAWRYGPANTGLLAWYESQYYADNEVFSHLHDYPGFGPKGRMLVVDAHPEPYRDPVLLAAGYPNEGANLPHRSLMRDAPFSLRPTAGFTMRDTDIWATAYFAGRPKASVFTDALDYTPGAEYTHRSPAQADRWVTRQWDAGTVLPSTVFSGVRAPGYVGSVNAGPSNEFRFDCGIGWPSGLLGCYWLGSNRGLGYDGSTGAPGEVDGQYGWNARILSQTASTARVQVWNSWQTPRVLLAAPNDGETVRSGEYFVISWGAPAAAASFDLFYSLNGGRTWLAIQKGVPGSRRSFLWNAPALGGNRPCLVKVVARNGAGRATGTARNGRPFTLETLRLTAPEGRQTLKGGATVHITWDTAGTTAQIESTVLSYTIDGGRHWQPIDTVAGNPGVYAWTLPATAVARRACAVKVVLKDAGGAVLASDRGNRAFKLVP